ncbi:SLC8A1 [Symbiodinium pilosum]|uniref:SLC8A1 protein n=1 Tax=Symbiodinium pilosum TaxID=2952 RepID=A0A812SYL3_SYMPI|nr:SLC8A1 [Symbiodinium pilosum]
MVMAYLRNRDVMLRQTRHLRLADMVQLTDCLMGSRSKAIIQSFLCLCLFTIYDLGKEKNYCFVWSEEAVDPNKILLFPKAFRAKYADLGPGLAASTPDEEVCRIIVKSAGGDEGTVGSENVFGGKILEQLLEHKLQEKMAGAQHLEGTKSEMKLLMEEKLKAETIQREQQQERLKELESLRGQHEDHQNKQQLLMQQLQEQQLQLQRQQQEQMEALRKQQEMELERLRKQQEEASAAAVAALEAAKEKEAPPAPVHPTDPTLRRPTEAAGAPSSRPSRIRRQTTDHSLHSLHALRFRIPTGSPEEEGRPRQNHPALHAALAQMAAILRVAKEREQNFKASEEFQDQMLRDLQAERDGWKQEIQMLTEQVGDLRQSLEDPSWQRRPGSGSLHAALCPPEVMDQPGRSP